MSDETRKLRQLVNRVDVVIRKIQEGAYSSQSDIRAELRDALLKTGEWVH